MTMFIIGATLRATINADSECETNGNKRLTIRLQKEESGESKRTPRSEGTIMEQNLDEIRKHFGTISETSRQPRLRNNNQTLPVRCIAAQLNH